LYDDGDGVAKDPAAAVRWCRKTAEQGCAEAQLNLGLAFHMGEGVEKNDAEAVRWCHKAAEQGAANAEEVLRLTSLQNK
jgi:TPR repeat protein